MRRWAGPKLTHLYKISFWHSRVFLHVYFLYWCEQSALMSLSVGIFSASYIRFVQHVYLNKKISSLFCSYSWTWTIKWESLTRNNEWLWIWFCFTGIVKWCAIRHAVYDGWWIFLSKEVKYIHNTQLFLNFFFINNPLLVIFIAKNNNNNKNPINA